MGCTYANIYANMEYTKGILCTMQKSNTLDLINNPRPLHILSPRQPKIRGPGSQKRPLFLSTVPFGSCVHSSALGMCPKIILSTLTLPRVCSGFHIHVPEKSSLVLYLLRPTGCDFSAMRYDIDKQLLLFFYFSSLGPHVTILKSFTWLCMQRPNVVHIKHARQAPGLLYCPSIP